jgi:hypothetical protein
MKALVLAAAALAAAGALGGCGGNTAERDARITSDVEQNVADADTRAQELRTLASLAKIEESVANFVKAENQIPDNLDQLIPKYLAEIPPVEIGVRGHRDNNQVHVYPASVLRDGQIDGSQLKDTGRWGYVHNDRQVVVFVDCTHLSRQGNPWYQAHGAY